MFTQELFLSGGGDIGDRGHRSDEVAEAIDGTTLEIDGKKRRGAEVAMAFAIESVRLVGCLDVATEEDDPAWLQRRKSSAQVRRDFSAVETHDEKLSDLQAKLVCRFEGHDKQSSVTRALGACRGGNPFPHLPKVGK